MGILNVTPDSFSDGGQFVRPGAALHRAREMWSEGAAIIDVGGESTRPGATPVAVPQELDRVIPVIEAIRRELEVLISVDTSKPEVMAAAIEAGAVMVNDINGLRAQGATEVVADTGVAACIMHMQGEPRSMQQSPGYENVVAEVRDYLEERARACLKAGIAANSLVVDPGFGFGKTVIHNLQLLGQLDRIVALGYPVLAGLSRKSMIGAILDRPAGDRLAGSLALAALALWQGAAILRVHDVDATVQATKMVYSVMNNK